MGALTRVWAYLSDFLCLTITATYKTCLGQAFRHIQVSMLALTPTNCLELLYSANTALLVHNRGKAIMDAGLLLYLS